MINCSSVQNKFLLANFHFYVKPGFQGMETVRVILLNIRLPGIVNWMTWRPDSYKNIFNDDSNSVDDVQALTCPLSNKSFEMYDILFDKLIQFHGISNESNTMQEKEYTYNYTYLLNLEKLLTKVNTITYSHYYDPSFPNIRCSRNVLVYLVWGKYGASITPPRTPILYDYRLEYYCKVIS